MKRVKYFMGIILVAGLLSASTTVAQAQTLTKKEKRHLEQMRRRKEKSEQREISHAYYLQLVKKRYFVFQADYLTDTQGNSFILSPDINFWRVSGDSTVLQLGFDNVIGWNGVGGITVRGTLFHYQVQEGKKGSGINLHTDVKIIGPGLPPHLTLYVSDDGTAQLTIVTGTGVQITLFGRIFSPARADIFQGVSQF